MSSSVTENTLTVSRRQLLARMQRFFDPRQLSEVELCSAALKQAANSADDPRRLTILVAYGGGKDSTFALAIARLLQLMYFETRDLSLTLRVATWRHPGMPNGVFENIDRAYRSLAMYDDPSCELLIVDADEVAPFDPTRRISLTARTRARERVLWNGHRTQANSRPTFCNQCNFDLTRFFGVALRYRDGADFLVTGDSSSELRSYRAWMTHAAREVGVQQCKSRHPLKATLEILDDMNVKYAEEIGAVPPVPLHGELPRTPEFLRLFSYVTYNVEDHWELLTSFLGFSFEGIGFSFTETDCANPSLMAHIHGLRFQYVFGRTYAEGLLEYLDYGLDSTLR